MTRTQALAVVGSTACGKSELALALARRLNGEILCMDSMQVYRRMDVGTAKPTQAEQALVPHHLLDVVEPTEAFSVADYVALAESTLAEVAARGRVPILVGGTGLYLKSLMHGMTLGGVKSDPALREKYEAMAALPGGNLRLHGLLAQADPESAQRLHPNDVRRVVRALESYQLTGVPVSQQKRQEPERPYDIFPIGLRMPRLELFRRIQARGQCMMAAGLLQEVEALLQSGVPPEAQAMQGIGYKELVPVAQGHGKPEWAEEQIILNTRHYAKRQETWFKAETRIHWVDAGEHALDEATELARRFLAGEEAAGWTQGKMPE